VCFHFLLLVTVRQVWAGRSKAGCDPKRERKGAKGGGEGEGSHTHTEGGGVSGCTLHPLSMRRRCVVLYQRLPTNSCPTKY